MALSHTQRYDPDRCRGIVGTTGEQCSSGKTPFCGNHVGFDDMRRVDSYEGELDEDLRDELVDLGIDGHWSYALAIAADDVEDCWRIVSGARDVNVGVYLRPQELANLAPEIATHDELDVDDHPLADDRCIALIEAEQDEGLYRCPSERYGLGLLCGGHRNADDVETVLEDQGRLLELETIHAEGEEFYKIEDRDGDAIAIDSEWTITRLPEGWLDPEDVEGFERATELESDDDQDDLEDELDGFVDERQSRRSITEHEAELLELVRDRVDGELDLDLDLQQVEDVAEGLVPVKVAAEGQTIVAAYLRGHGISRGEISEVLEISNQTISQYMSDLKAGRR